MNVYIVEGFYSYEGEDILGVFDSKQKAEDYLSKHIIPDKWCHDLHEITEHILQ